MRHARPTYSCLINYSWLSSCSTARETSTGLSLVGPTRNVKWIIINFNKQQVPLANWHPKCTVDSDIHTVFF